MIRGAVAALVFVLLVGTASAASPRLHFPRDHYGHPKAGIEWWYFTGVVQGADGHRYSVFFTLFSRGGYVLPISQVIDLETGAVVGHTETVAQAKVAATKVDVAVPGARLRYQRSTNTWLASASQSSGYSLSLVATPQKPYVLHGGGTGTIQTPVGPSAYYSSTRMTARGTITAGGAPLSFTGTAWFDHQWGNFASDPSGLSWDWFSCRFDDRTEVMLYRFRDPNGTPLSPHQNVTYVQRNGRGRVATTAFIGPTERALDAAGHQWPLGWKLIVPSLDLVEQLSAIVDDQLFRGTIVPTFYEGAANARGTKTGICFVEETYGA